MTDHKAFALLEKLVSFQSVSTDKQRRKELIKTAEFINDKFVSMGFTVILYQEEKCPPLIVATKTIPGAKKTMGIYAHYDVQPEDPIGKWLSPPFTLTERDSKLYGRGVADDKMHVVQSMVAADNAIAEGTLKHNLVFLIEGEEETGSEHFETLVKKAGINLDKIDVFYVLDVGMKRKSVPQIFYGLRGIAGFELKLRTGTTDLHSGVYGNRVFNPAQVAADLFSKMKNEKGEVTIPGFYDNVRKFEREEIEILSKFSLDKEEERKNAGVIKMAGQSIDSKIKPSLEINGITSGYTGQGFKTIIPAEATVKFSVRLIEHQKGQDMISLIEKFVADNLPSGVEHEFSVKEASDPFYTDYKNPYTEKTAEVLESVFGGECLFNRSGGSIAAAEILQRVYKKPVVLIGFTLPDENIHAPQENVDIEMFEKGIVALQKIFSVAP